VTPGRHPAGLLQALATATPLPLLVGPEPLVVDATAPPLGLRCAASAPVREAGLTYRPMVGHPPTAAPGPWAAGGIPDPHGAIDAVLAVLAVLAALRDIGTMAELPSPEVGTQRFLADRPGLAAPILHRLCKIAREASPAAGYVFPGRRFYEHADDLDALPPNLTFLATSRYAILEKVGPSTRRGAYYRMRDVQAVEAQLRALGYNQ